MQLDALRIKELKLAVTLASVSSLRMLGLFLILPVFMVLAQDIPGFTPQLGGLAVGIYGLTQAALQQPFGWLSDRFGRRPLMLMGLMLFAAGGLLAAHAETMYGVIAGRALQGCGAISGVAMAFAADFTRQQYRSVTMAIIGLGIGIAFLLSMAVSVPLANLMGLRGLLALTGFLGLLGMLLILTTPRSRAEPAEVTEAHRDDPAPIRLLALSVFVLHASMTLLFVVLPGMLMKDYGFALSEHWKIYVPAMIFSVLCILPLLRYTGSRGTEGRMLPWAFAVLGGALILLPLEIRLVWVVLIVVIYFTGLNILEAIMPSLVARLTEGQGRGRKMGLYSTLQFLGAFAGGAGGGILLATVGSKQALVLAGVICLLWAALTARFAKSLFLTRTLQRL